MYGSLHLQEKVSRQKLTNCRQTSTWLGALISKDRIALNIATGSAWTQANSALANLGIDRSQEALHNHIHQGHRCLTYRNTGTQADGS